MEKSLNCSDHYVSIFSGLSPAVKNRNNQTDGMSPHLLSRDVYNGSMKRTQCLTLGEENSSRVITEEHVLLHVLRLILNLVTVPKNNGHVNGENYCNRKHRENVEIKHQTQ